MSNSQLGQDTWALQSTLHHWKNGRPYFVEVGGHDGVRHSNTLMFERYFQGTGLLVEANPELYARSLENRPACKHACVAVGATRGRAKFILGDSYGGLLETMPEAFTVEHVRRRNPIVEVEVVPLHDLLVQHEMPESIDYLSLDVEGAEYDILEAFFRTKTKFRFSALTVEFRYDMLYLERLMELLAKNGYRLDTTLAFDACFLDESLC